MSNTCHRRFVTVYHSEHNACVSVEGNAVSSAGLILLVNFSSLSVLKCATSGPFTGCSSHNNAE